MTTFLFSIAFGAACFGLGYWISGHPTDARDFFARVRDSVGHLFHRDPKPKE